MLNVLAAVLLLMDDPMAEKVYPLRPPTQQQEHAFYELNDVSLHERYMVVGMATGKPTKWDWNAEAKRFDAVHPFDTSSDKPAGTLAAISGTGELIVGDLVSEDAHMVFVRDTAGNNSPFIPKSAGKGRTAWLQPRAADLSKDGRFVVGWIEEIHQGRGSGVYAAVFRWDRKNESVDWFIADPSSAGFARVARISPDGKTLVGTIETTLASTRVTIPVCWKQNAVANLLELGLFGKPVAVSDDGNVVVGNKESGKAGFCKKGTAQSFELRPDESHSYVQVQEVSIDGRLAFGYLANQKIDEQRNIKAETETDACFWDLKGSSDVAAVSLIGKLQGAKPEWDSLQTAGAVYKVADGTYALTGIGVNHTIEKQVGYFVITDLP